MKTLQQFTEDVARLSVRLGAQGEMLGPRLMILAEDGSTDYYALDPNDAHRAQWPALARAYVGAHDALYAAITLEHWSTRLRGDDPRWAQIGAGTLSLGDLPAHERVEGLTIIGQDRALARAMAHYTIAPDRVFTRADAFFQGADAFSSRFLPLFRFHKGMDAPYHFTEAQARHHVQVASVSVLAAANIHVHEKPDLVMRAMTHDSAAVARFN